MEYACYDIKLRSYLPLKYSALIAPDNHTPDVFGKKVIDLKMPKKIYYIQDVKKSNKARTAD